MVGLIQCSQCLSTNGMGTRCVTKSAVKCGLCAGILVCKQPEFTHTRDIGDRHQNGRDQPSIFIRQGKLLNQFTGNHPMLFGSAQGHHRKPPHPPVQAGISSFRDDRDDFEIFSLFAWVVPGRHACKSTKNGTGGWPHFVHVLPQADSWEHCVGSVWLSVWPQVGTHQCGETVNPRTPCPPSAPWAMV